MSHRPLSRREFLKLSSELTLSASVASLLYSENAFAGLELLQEEMSFSILQGVTSDTETQLTVDVPVGMQVQFRLVGETSGRVFLPNRAEVIGFSDEPWQVHQIGFSGLSVNETYFFHVLDAGQNVLDERILKTLDLSNTNPRLGFISCTRDSFKNKKAWDGVYKTKPDMLVLMGDNIYGDLKVKPNPRNLWRRFIQGRQRISYYHRKHLIPCVATWDDHDYGKNNETGDYKYKENSLRNFEAFFPQSELNGVFQRGPGLSSCYRGFGLQIIMLDDRYFRSHKDDKNGTTIGDTQRSWVFDRLKEFAGPAWIVHGSVVFGEYDKGEAWEHQYKKDLHHFIDGVRATNRKVLFASGDVHHTETQTIESDLLGYETLELTSSGLHTWTFPFSKKNDRRRHIKESKAFAIVEHELTSDELKLGIDCVGKKGKHYFRDDFTLDLNG